MALQSPPRYDLASIALFLDVDGTLIDIAPRPGDVAVPRDLLTALEALDSCRDCAVALISDRPIAQLDTLFSPLRLAASGCPGAEMRLSARAPIAARMPLDDSVKRQFTALVRDFPGAVLEDKRYSVALHYRGTLAREAEILAAAATRMQGFAGFELLRGKAVIEIKPSGYDKGTAFAEFLNHPPFSQRIPVFLGDDITDESVFARLAEYGGMGIAVGRAIAGARYRLGTPGDVRNWLIGLVGESVAGPS
jgi:trehalose 6-phosphate phosphatase